MVNRPLKILMMIHVPWNRNQGAPRVQLELADEFQSLGHHVDKFDFNDAFPSHQYSRSSRFTQFIRPSFAAKAKAFVQSNSHRFDVIDAHQGNLPYSKEQLRFNGLLVSRSVGLHAFSAEFAKLEKSKWPGTKKGNPLAKILRSWRWHLEAPNDLKSFQTCDLINLPNQDEMIYVRDVWGLGNKCVVFPFGLSSQRQQMFCKAIQPAPVRLQHKQVVFIGYWTPRKGSRDWAKIIVQTKSKIPDVNFLFLGTGISVDEVLTDLDLPPVNWIKIIPSYNSDELPELLSGATVGAFPSYMEGFGFAVLEKIASGLPTVTYDIPGPREILRHLDRSFMVPLGDIDRFTTELVRLLQLDEQTYNQISKNCVKVAQKFCWSKIAKAQLDTYCEFLEKSQES